MKPHQTNIRHTKKPVIALDRSLPNPVLIGALGLTTDDGYLTANEVCAIVGGKEHPISKATLYRNIKAGRLPPPEHPTPGISRWRPSKIMEAMVIGRERRGIEKQIFPAPIVGAAQ